MPRRAQGRVLPTDLRPMLAVAGTLPGEPDGWAYEVKWDGVRALVAVEGGTVCVTSRNGNDVSASYPELHGLAGQVGEPLLLDGEVVTVDAAGRTDFGRLQSRMHVARPAPDLLERVPVQLLVFDLLQVGTGPLLDRPWSERRERLEGLGLAGPHWEVPAAFLGGGADLLAATGAQGLEGVVAKRTDSRYLPGRRSEHWRKVKHVRRTSAVVAGWRPGQGGRAGRIGSLLLGVPGPQGLEYAGHVGTGFSAQTLAMLARRLEPLRRAGSPFAGPVPRAQERDAVWVEPVLVAEVDYTEWTRDGRLRHPSYKGLRDDIGPQEVTRQ